MASNDWDVLAAYESFELVKQQYLKRHGRETGTQHAREIAASFIHGRSYFMNARDADLTVKPLLLYYGVVNLSRGLTLFLTRSLREISLAPSHGLSPVEWPAVLNKVNPDFSELRIKLTASGTAMSLLRATKHRSLLRTGSSEVNFSHACDSPPSGTAITFGDIISRVPSLREQYALWKNYIECAPIDVRKFGDSEQVIVSVWRWGNDLCDQSLAQRIFDGSPFGFLGFKDGGFEFIGPKIHDGPGPILSDTILHTFGGIGQLWAATKMPNNFGLSKIMSLFISSYILGMLVRYYPTQWTALCRGQINDAALPTLSTAIDVIATSFPCVVVDFLQEKVVMR